jgi:hypothetical protein
MDFLICQRQRDYYIGVRPDLVFLSHALQENGLAKTEIYGMRFSVHTSLTAAPVTKLPGVPVGN